MVANLINCSAYCTVECRVPSAERNLLKDLLVNVVAGALYYNPALALQELQQQSRLTTFFSTWFQARSHSHMPLCLLCLIVKAAFDDMLATTNSATAHAGEVQGSGAALLLSSRINTLKVLFARR